MPRLIQGQGFQLPSGPAEQPMQHLHHSLQLETPRTAALLSLRAHLIPKKKNQQTKSTEKSYTYFRQLNIQSENHHLLSVSTKVKWHSWTQVSPQQKLICCSSTRLRSEITHPGTRLSSSAQALCCTHCYCRALSSHLCPTTFCRAWEM